MLRGPPGWWWSLCPRLRVKEGSTCCRINPNLYNFTQKPYSVGTWHCYSVLWALSRLDYKVKHLWGHSGGG